MTWHELHFQVHSPTLLNHDLPLRPLLLWMYLFLEKCRCLWQGTRRREGGKRVLIKLVSVEFVSFPSLEMNVKRERNVNQKQWDKFLELGSQSLFYCPPYFVLHDRQTLNLCSIQCRIFWTDRWVQRGKGENVFMSPYCNVCTSSSSSFSLLSDPLLLSSPSHERWEVMSVSSWKESFSFSLQCLRLNPLSQRLYPFRVVS